VKDRQFQANPFEDSTATGMLRGLPTFEEALARLLHLADHGRPCGIVRGPVGSGKSILLEFVAQDVRRRGQEPGRIDLRLTPHDAFAWRVAGELGTAPTMEQATGCWQKIEDAVVGRALASQSTLFLVDHLEVEGRGLSGELARLLSLAESSSGWCSVLAAGRDTSPAVLSLIREYAEIRIELPALEAAETENFLERVCSETGCVPFAKDAREGIHERTGGLVRDILRLSRLCVLACRAEAATEVSLAVVDRVAGELPLIPHRRGEPSRGGGGMGDDVVRVGSR
jgi:type II secretory pathway predicted ATPase ExeA